MKRVSVLLASFAIGFFLSAFVVDLDSYTMIQLKGMVTFILLFIAATIWIISEIRKLQQYIENKDERKAYLKTLRGHGGDKHVES